MKTKYHIINTPSGILIVNKNDLVPFEIPEKTSELINNGDGTKEFLTKDGLSIQTVLDTYYGNTNWRTSGTPSAAAIESALDAYYGNTEWRDATLTGSDIETILDAYYGNTDWRTGGSGDVSTDTIWDAKGDIVAATAADTATRLAVGTNGQVLTADSAEATGLKWSTPAGTGDMLAATYDPTAVNGDAFDMDNMVEGTTTKILTDTERSNISASKVITDFLTVTGATDLDTMTTDVSASKTITDFITITQAVDLDTMETDVAANNAKTGITAQQASDIAANNLKIGITPSQAANIVTNNAKVSFPEAPNDGNEYVRKNESWSLAGISTSSPLTTKGDVYTYDTDNQRLPVGADGTFLTADSAEATGLKWAVPPGGGDVTKVGTPVANQVGVWTGDGTIQGLTTFLYERTTNTDTLTFGGDYFNLKIGTTNIMSYFDGDSTVTMPELTNFTGGIRFGSDNFYNSGGDVITVPSTTGTLALNYLTTKGDLLTYSTVNARLPIGQDGEVLTADSAEQTGMKWQSPTDAVLSKSVSVTTTTYTVQLGDEAGLIDCSNASDITITIDTYANQAIPVGSILLFRQTGVGNVIVKNNDNTSEYGRTYYPKQTIALWHESIDNWLVLNPPQSKQYDGYALSASDGTPENTTILSDRVVGTKIYTDVRLSVNTAETTNTLTLDVHKNGTTIFATQVTIDATEETSVTATTPFAFTGGASQVVFADDDKIEFIISGASNSTGAIVKMIE